MHSGLRSLVASLVCEGNTTIASYDLICKSNENP